MLRSHQAFGWPFWTMLRGLKNRSRTSSARPSRTISRSRTTRCAPEPSVMLDQCPDMSHLTSRFDALRDSENFFFALRVDGPFDYVHTRAMCRTKEGVPLVQAAAVQPEFELHDVSGTLVGFWTPEYAKTLNVPGYHLHFLSTDHEYGGHLLQCCGLNLRLQ